MLSRLNASYGSHMAAAIIVAAVTISCLIVEAKLPYKIALKEATYTMKSEVITTHEAIQLEEFHSSERRRSRVNYRIRARAGPLNLDELPSGFSDWFGSFIADDQDVVEVYFNCKAVDHAAVGRALQINMLDTNDISSFHVIGVARLLMDIERRSEKFEPPVLGGKLSADTYAARIGNYEVTVHYDGGRDLGLGVPSTIHLADKESSYSIIVRPKLVIPLKSDEIISAGPGLSGVRQPSDSANDLLFDVFAIDRTRGCARHLKNPNSVLNNKYRFSFKANLVAKDIRPVELVVGYEPMLATLRVDHSYGTKWSQTITNFRHDRRYNVVKRVTGGNGHRPYGDFFDVRHANDFSCVVTRAGSTEISAGLAGNMHTLGRMLYGASQLVYLGMARVRGMDAYMYAADNSKLPVWLDVPSFYESQAGAQELRDGYLPSEKSPIELTTVLYFKKMLSMADNKLLLIEIFTSNNINLYTIPIYEFSTDIRPTVPTGERWEDFFSLGDACLAPSTGNNHYARFNLQLKIVKSNNSSQASAGLEWVKQPAKRNLALYKSFDDRLKLPSTLVYDLESRSRGPLDDLNEMAVTFMVAERKREPLKIKYLGKSREPRGECDIEQVISFQNCLELAAHRQTETLFAYSSHRSQCYIYTGRQVLPANLNIHFPMDLAGQFEVYRTVQGAESEPARDAHLAKLDETRDRILDDGNMFLDDPSVYELRPSVPLRVISAEVEHLDEKVAYDLDEHHLADINKFPGLGLVPDDTQNKLVAPKGALGESITFEQCQEACLIDLECQAYSTCIVRGKIQCVLSSVDFKVPTTVIELMLLKDKKSKLGEVSKIKLSGAGEPDVSTQTVDLSSIHIKKHPTCELHNKLYRDVFKPAGLSRVDLKGRLLRPVAHPEECAEFCFLGTLATMRKEVRRLHKTTHGKDDPGLTEGYSASHCGHYFYLDQQKLASSKMKIPAEQIIGMNTDGATRGYCVFDDGSTGEAPVSHQKDTTSLWLVFELRKFKLDFTVLYEKKHGISLVSSMKTHDEELAYEKLLNRRDYTSEHLEVMRKFIRAGGNTARMGFARNAQDCARTCFTQSLGPWPACRSFDVVELTTKETATRMSVCVYSTSTVADLRQLGRNELIRENSTQSYLIPTTGDEIQVWHYEPRQGLVASSLEQEYQISIDRSESRLEQLRKMTSASLHLSTFGLSLTICVVLVAGLCVGMKVNLSPRIEQSLSQTGIANGRSRGDKEILVDDADDL